MKIINHKLVAEGSEKIFHNRKAKITKNYLTADNLPKDLIIHYTAGGLQGSLATLEGNKASVHLVIDRDGTIYQMAPFNVATAHAGYSVWEDNSGLNNRSIGIELINMGFDVDELKPENILNLKHKHKFVNETKWEKYPQKQMDSLITVSKVLFKIYLLNRVLGHDDISSGRKQDPGPAFDWDTYKTAIFGFTNPVGKIFITKGETNFRKTNQLNPNNIIKLLPKDYEVGVIETWDSWYKVYLCNKTKEVIYYETVNGKRTQKNKKEQGWIHSSRLKLKKP